MARQIDSEIRRVRPLFWVASSKRDLKALPPKVRRLFGYALWEAQLGGRHEHAKVLKGFGGSGVLELVEDHKGSAYRAVYTVRFAGAIFALHIFQKKSKKGIETPPRDIELIRKRLSMAEELYEEWRAQQETENQRGS